MSSRFFRRISVVHRWVGRRLRLLSLRLKYDWVDFPGSLSVGANTRIAATDNGQFEFGKDVSVDSRATLIAKHGRILIGDGSHIGIGTIIVAREHIEIGNKALIAEYVTIRDQDHGTAGEGPFADQPFESAPVRIGNNVWLGAKCTVLKGVTIGDNTVVGANSVVSRDLPANVVAAGVPARIIRQRSARALVVDESSPRY